MVVVPQTPVNWSRLCWYRPTDFSFPDELEDSVVGALDALSTILGRKLTILDDVRHSLKGGTSQHFLGKAIDFTTDLPVDIVLSGIQKIAFTGYGLYVNAKGILSYHVDTRTDRSPANPATWGGQKITEDQDQWTYTSLRSILDYIKPAAPALIWVVLLGIAIYYLAKASKDS